MENERTLLESIKSKKLDTLKANNIPEKYRAELSRKKIVIWKTFYLYNHSCKNNKTIIIFHGYIVFNVFINNNLCKNYN